MASIPLPSAAISSTPHALSPASPPSSLLNLGSGRTVSQSKPGPRELVLVRAQQASAQPQYRASEGTASERLLAQIEQALPRVGVDVQDPRVSLVLSVGAQAGRMLEQGLLSAFSEATKYTSGARREMQPSSWEEALMSVPDLETIPYTVVERRNGVEIRQVQSYLVAEVSMTSSQGFDAIGSGRAFNTLAEYLFGKNKARESMEMTTPVVSRRQGTAMEMTTPVISSRRGSQAMEMTTPVISRRESGRAMEMTTPVLSNRDSKAGWRMSFVIPSEFNESSVPLPDNDSVSIRRVPQKMVAVSVFSGFVSDDDVARRERSLRQSVEQLGDYSVAAGADVEVAQYNPPFTLPWSRRNEISVEVNRT